MSVNFMKDFDFSKLSHFAIGGAVKPSPGNISIRF